VYQSQSCVAANSSTLTTAYSLTMLLPFSSHSSDICLNRFLLTFLLLSNMLLFIGTASPGNCMCHDEHSLLRHPRYIMPSQYNVDNSSPLCNIPGCLFVSCQVTDAGC
jgi:hypothetical protein